MVAWECTGTPMTAAQTEGSILGMWAPSNGVPTMPWVSSVATEEEWRSMGPRGCASAASPLGVRHSEGGGEGPAGFLDGDNEELTGAEELLRAETETLLGMGASVETVIAAATPSLSVFDAWEAAGPLVVSLACMRAVMLRGHASLQAVPQTRTTLGLYTAGGVWNMLEMAELVTGRQELEAGFHFEGQVGLVGLPGLWDHLNAHRPKPTASSQTSIMALNGKQRLATEADIKLQR
ncbi:MAG: hypothetical protein FRX49_02239 [Trebouxia sp. A1-2]|nr:MAG: hypothetical protein FRX49_02239 [Trebouxia sp. A1-2]